MTADIPATKREILALITALQRRVSRELPGAPGGMLRESVAVILSELEQVQRALKDLVWAYEGVRNRTAADDVRRLGEDISKTRMDCVAADPAHLRNASFTDPVHLPYIASVQGRSSAQARLQGIERALARLP
jgi:hypothetical protein